MKKVNEVSRLAGVSKRTLQFYDDEGLLPAQRSKDNYRLYDDAALERLWEILVYRAMGLDLKEIKYLLTLSEKQQKQYLEKKIRGLYDFDLQEKWYKYRDDCYEQIARDWCERFGIEIEE